MRTGASGVCSMGGLTGECNSAELRFWYGDEQIFKDNLKYCIESNIYAICNLDFHKWDSHYPFDINRLEAMMTIMAECGATKTNSRITVENEPMKYWSKEEYCDMVNQSHAFIAGRYDMGAGGEEFGLAMARGLFPYLFETAEFEYFDIHIQATMIDPATWRVNFDTVNHYLTLARRWADTYGKKLSCTEANWSKIKTAEGHADLMQERELARQFGCEDFNIVFIDGKMSKYEWLAYTVNGSQNSPYWNDLRQKMLDEKEEIKPIEELEDMKLTVLKIGSKGNQVEWLQLILEEEYGYENTGGADGAFGPLTDTQVKEYQGANGLAVDGLVGKNTMSKLINEAGQVNSPAYWDNMLKIFMAYE